MAGSRHHVIPRFLLRGFASRATSKANKKENIFVWVHPKGKEPYECNIVNVGVEREFYGQGAQSVDDEITDIEGPFANCLNHLRKSADDGSKVTDSTLLEFVAHLTARTKHLRESIIDSTGYLFDNVFGHLSEYNNWREFCLRYFTQHPEVIKEELEKFFLRVPMSAHKKAMARQRIKKMPIERILQFMDKENSEYEMLFEVLRLKFTVDLSDVVKQAHIKSLLKNLVSQPRVEHYQKLHWYVRRSSEPLVLGDVCCLFKIESKYKSLGGTEDAIERIYLPIASDCVVVGNLRDEVPDISVTELNGASVRVSRDYFISSVHSADMNRLSDLLGTESQMATEDELEQIVSEVIYEP